MDHWRRIGLAVYASGWLVLSVSFWNLRDLNYSYGPYVWPFWYLLTAIVTIAFDIKPQNFNLYRLAGAMGIIGLLSRVGGLYITYATETGNVIGWQLPVGLVVYSMAASGLWYWWRHAIGPWHRKMKR